MERAETVDQCPVCGIELDAASLPLIHLRTPRGDKVWAKCSGCRSFFMTERYNPEMEIEHTLTRPWGAPESGKALNEHKDLLFESVLRALRRYARQGSTLLDIGCSYGGFLRRAQREGYQVRGMDIVPEAVEYVRSLGIPCDWAGSVQELDLPENSQAVISVLDCNYYWSNQRSELRALRSRLCPGGILAMRVVDTSWAVQAGLWLRQWLPTAGRRVCEKAVYDHRVSIPVPSLLGILRGEGFEIIYTSPRDAIPSGYSSLKVKAAHIIGHFAWRLAGLHLAPGCVILARKQVS